MKIKNKSSNRSFGILFAIVFLLIGVWPILSEGDFRIWSLVIALTFLILGIINSTILSPLNKLWFKFGIFLGNFISPIVMGIVFFLVVTPTGFTMRLLGKDLLNIKKNKMKSYWIKKKGIKSKMKNQF